MSWKVGTRRPRTPLEVTIGGRAYKGWVGQIFKLYIKWAEIDDRHLSTGWEDHVWKALKAAYPAYIIYEDDYSPPVVNIASVKSFASMIRRRGLARSLVPEEEAKRRAAICSACPAAGPVSGCGVCKSLVRQILKTPKSNMVPADKAGCTVCGCFNDAKVWIPREFLDEEFSSSVWDPKCWMNE